MPGRQEARAMLVFPVLTAVVLVALTVAVFRQYRQRHRPYQAAWSAAMAVGALASIAYVLCVLAGDNPVLFRAYYLGGAVLVAPLVGLGSAYLLPNPLWARIYLGVTAAGGLLGIAGLLTQPLDRAALRQLGYGPGTGVVHGAAILVPLIVLNSLGTVAVVGVALWSVYRSALRHAPWVFVGGNALIAGGTLLVALAGSLARLGAGAGFWGTMAVGWVVVYVGVVLMAAYRPAARTAAAGSAA
jgi:hypothetical protein